VNLTKEKNKNKSPGSPRLPSPGSRRRMDHRIASRHAALAAKGALMEKLSGLKVSRSIAKRPLDAARKSLAGSLLIAKTRRQGSCYVARAVHEDWLAYRHAALAAKGALKEKPSGLKVSRSIASGPPIRSSITAVVVLVFVMAFACIYFKSVFKYLKNKSVYAVDPNTPPSR